jgi:thiol-disulfide isomerase/thioredoxin
MSLPTTLLLALAPQTVHDLAGQWRGTLECPGGELPFGLSIEEPRPGELVGWLINGPERRRVPRLEVVEPGGIVPQYRLHLDPYDSRLEFVHVGGELRGEWVRYRDESRETRLPFRATAGADAPRFALGEVDPRAANALAGRWRVDFSSSEDDAVGLLEVQDGGAVVGTFLTTLGDYRWLAGATDGRSLRLSVFDGAHAFLFAATVQADGSLAGDFWSRDSWHETWTAVKDPRAALPDPFGLTTWTGALPLGELAFPDLDGKRRALDEEAFAGKVRLLVLFGSWCPNCYDETRYLVELHRRYAERGLSILGLAFEFGDDLPRQRRVLKRFVEHLGVEYPILIAGTNDKAKASQAFPLLDRVRSYPTTVFLDGTGEVLAVHTGFSGPATGEAHQRLRERFEALIDDALTGER